MPRPRLSAAAVATIALAIALPAQGKPAPVKLRGTVGPGFTIALTKGGKKVTTLRPGAYSLTIVDKGADHNFHLKGPGVNVKSSVAGTKTKTYPITLKRGTYRFVCDPHDDTMKGSFKVR